MCDFMRSMNKIHIWMINCHPEKNSKLKNSGLVSSLFILIFSLIFQITFGGGGKKEPLTSKNHDEFDGFCLIKKIDFKNLRYRNEEQAWLIFQLAVIITFDL